MEFVLATNNQKKLKEMQQILQDGCRTFMTLAQAGVQVDPEEDGTTFEANALIKARAACAASGKAAIADDSGLEVDALGGEPGVYSARYCPGTDADRVDYLLEKLRDVPREQRTARFVSAIACVLPDGTEFTVRGACEGEITFACAGAGGFGYDPVFYVPSCGGTFAEIPQEEKNRISHRGCALALLRAEMEKRGL